MAETAPLRIVYRFEDGAESDLALGQIDRMGQITVSKVAPGEEARLDRMLAELNGAEHLFLRDGVRVPAGETRARKVKRSVLRGDPEFLAALIETAARFFRVELRFDPALLEGSGGYAPEADLGADFEEPEVEDAEPIAALETRRGGSWRDDLPPDSDLTGDDEEA